MMTSFERRHFEAIAVVLSAVKPSEMRYNLSELSGEQRARVEQWQRTVRHMASALQGTNSRFDAARFLKACGA